MKYEDLQEVKYFKAKHRAKLDDAIGEALDIANKLDCIVMLEFNDVLIKIYPGDEIRQKIKEYYRELDKITSKEIKEEVKNMVEKCKSLTKKK